MDVTLPDAADSYGHVFHLGINDLKGQTAVDSNFTTGGLEHLARQVRDLHGSADYGTVTPPAPG